MLSNSQVWPQGLQHKSKHIKVNNTSNSFMTSMNEYCLTIWNIYTQTPQSRPCGHHELLMVMEKKLVCFFNCTFFQTPHSFYKMYLFAQSRIFACMVLKIKKKKVEVYIHSFIINPQNSNPHLLTCPTPLPSYYFLYVVVKGEALHTCSIRPAQGFSFRNTFGFVLTYHKSPTRSRHVGEHWECVHHTLWVRPGPSGPPAVSIMQARAKWLEETTAA